MSTQVGCEICRNWESNCLCPMQNDAEVLSCGGPIKLVAAAVRQDGVVFAVRQPARHHNVMAMMRHHYGLDIVEGHEQGFLVSDGRFVGRHEARRIAGRAEQLLPRPPDRPLPEDYMLTSEDVW